MCELWFIESLIQAYRSNAIMQNVNNTRVICALSHQTSYKCILNHKVIRPHLCACVVVFYSATCSYQSVSWFTSPQAPLSQWFNQESPKSLSAARFIAVDALCFKVRSTRCFVRMPLFSQLHLQYFYTIIVSYVVYCSITFINVLVVHHVHLRKQPLFVHINSSPCSWLPYLILPLSTFSEEGCTSFDTSQSRNLSKSSSRWLRAPLLLSLVGIWLYFLTSAHVWLLAWRLFYPQCLLCHRLCPLVRSLLLQVALAVLLWHVDAIHTPCGFPGMATLLWLVWTHSSASIARICDTFWSCRHCACLALPSRCFVLPW